jgi:hypothetical protein
MMSYDRDEVAEMLTSKFPVYLDAYEYSSGSLALRRNRDDITLANLYNDAIVILGPDHVTIQIQYDDPDFEDKVVKRMHLRLYGTEEDYLRFKRQEDVKRYFTERKP